MLTALIVKVYRGLVELMLWGVIVAGGFAASKTDRFSELRLTDEWIIDKEIVGFAAGALAAFLAAALIFGAVLTLIEIRKSLRRIERQLDRRPILQHEPVFTPPARAEYSTADAVQQQTSKPKKKKVVESD